jgi:hypothetical protein
MLMELLYAEPLVCMIPLHTYSKIDPNGETSTLLKYSGSTVAIWP